MTDLTRLTINLTRRAVDALDRAATKTGDSRTDTVNRALVVYATVTEFATQDGQIRMLHSDGTTVTVVVT